MSTAGLFRDSALRQQAAATSSTEGLVLVSSSARVATATALAICVAGLVASILVTVPITLDGHGVFLDSGGVGVVTADTAGRVVSLEVTEGASVKRGDVVAHIAQQELTTQTGDARAVLDAAVLERTRGLETMTRTRAALAAHDEVRLAASTRLIAIESENLERLKKRQAANEKLSREGFVSPMSLIDSEQEIIASKRRIDELRQPLENALVERRTREAEDAQRRLDLDLRVEEAERRVRDLEAALLRAAQVLSPRDGTVASLRVARGDVVDRETQIATIVASGVGKAPPLLAYGFIPAEMGSDIRPGMPARVLPSGVKPQEYGYMVATVKAVSELPVGSEEIMRLVRNRVLTDSLLREGAATQVTLELERADTPSGYKWSSSRGPGMKITHGTELEARVEVRHDRLATLALPWLKRVLP